MRHCFSLKVVFTLSRITAVCIAFSAIVVMSGCGGSPTTRSAAPAETDVSDSRSTTVAAIKEPATETETGVPSRLPEATNDPPRPVVESALSSRSAPTNDQVQSSQPAGLPSEPPINESATDEQIAKWAIPDFEPFRLLACYDGFEERLLRCLAVSPDENQFVTGGQRLLLWNTAESKPIVDLLAEAGGQYEQPILSVAISPDGKWLAAGDSAGHLGIWNLEKRAEVVSIEANPGGVTQIAFSPNSEQIATTNFSGEVKLWQASNGKSINSFKLARYELERLVFVSDSLLASVGENAMIWKLDNGENAAVLDSERLLGSALAMSHDGRKLAFSDAKGIGFWDVEKSMATDIGLRGQSESIHLVDFSADGKWIATNSGRTNWIWETATGKSVQVIDADGGVTTDLKWLPTSNLLLIASHGGRVRIWGTTDAAQSIGLQPMELPKIETLAADSLKPLTWAQAQQVMDLQSFPRLPGAVTQYSTASAVSYVAPDSLDNARKFYRYCLERAGWTEIANKPNDQRLLFAKNGCRLSVGLSTTDERANSAVGEVGVDLFFAGNFDSKWVPSLPIAEVGNAYDFLAQSGYEVKADITDLEVKLLKSLHEAGWTAWTRLAVARGEDEPEIRTLSFLQGAFELSAFIRPPGNSPDLISVQTGVSMTNKSIPVPPDISWMECDFSTDLKLAAITKLGIGPARKFFDEQMAVEGWIARDDGRAINDGKDGKDGEAWLPFIRGQQDVTIRLVALENGNTGIYVSDGEQWKHIKEEVKIDPKLAIDGIEAADFPIPGEAEKVAYSAHDKRLTYDLPAIKPLMAIDLFAAALARLDWIRDDFGVLSKEYVYVDFTRGEATIEFRATLFDGSSANVSISGDGLLWQKPLPVPPKRISYATWMINKRLDFSLDHLDEFSKEVRSIPIIREAIK